MMFWSRPLVPVAILLMLGIVGARYIEPGLWWCVGGIGLGVGLLAWRRTRLTGVAVGIVALGMTLYAERYRVSSANDLRLILSQEVELVSVRGRLVDSPSVREFESGAKEIAYSYATLEVSEIEREKRWRPAAGRVVTRTRGELTPDFFQGRMVEVIGVIGLPPKAAAPGLFDYRAYLHNARIFHQLKSDSTNDWRLLSFEPLPVTERFRRWAQAQLGRGVPEQRGRDEAAEMILAMSLGLRNTLSGEMAEVFMRTGTMHIIAISGLHVACITMFLCFVLVYLLGVPRATGGLIVLAIVWFYTAATGLQSSAVRSALMASVFIMGWVLRRPGELVNTLAASAVLILLVQPEQLFQASFQLSFSVVLVIALMILLFEAHYPEAQIKFRHRVLKIDPLLPYELVPRWKKGLNWALGLALGNFMISAASWIGSLPLTAYYFNTVTPVSLLANMVAVPLSSVSLGATVLSLLVPPLGPVCNYVAWIFMGWTIQMVEFFARLPLGYFYVPKPNILFFAVYGVGLAVMLIPTLRVGHGRLINSLLVGGLSLAWLGSIWAGKPIAIITILPCAGTPAFVERAGEKNLLIDCSSERDADFMVKRFLRAKGYATVDQLLLTHGDAQMIGGFQMVWEQFRPATVFTSAAKMRSPGYRKAIDLLEANPARHRVVSGGDDADGWTVLHPSAKGRAFPRADDNALVMRRTIGRWTILHLSDLGSEGQKRLTESESRLRADIVITGMPERGEPLLPELIEKIQPKVIILGSNRFPYTAEGSPELRKRLNETGAEVFYVHEDGAVTIRISTAGCAVRGMEGKATTL